ncbi:MAG TPA: response regulator transcription factor [Acetobacteraceae bacterium]|nr:response regulator transcription factor [Acetobacteraceae bacterium]
MNVLLVEDDPLAVDYLRAGLAAEGHEVSAAADGRQGLLQAASNDFDLLIVDRMLPALDGLSMVTALRAMRIDTPVIFLTARGRIDDRVEGLRAGGDDYLVKPFALAELAARAAALARRRAVIPPATVLKVADLELNRLSQTAMRAQRRIPLKPREFRLLEYLMLHAGQVVTRTMLLEQVWDFHFDPQTSLVESHVSRLRAKIDRDFGHELIHTVRGSGYRLCDARPA